MVEFRLMYSARRARLTRFAWRRRGRFRFIFPRLIEGPFPKPTPEACRAAFSCLICMRRVSSSSQLSLRAKSFSQFPEKFMRIGESRSRMGRSSSVVWAMLGKLIARLKAQKDSSLQPAG